MISILEYHLFFHLRLDLAGRNGARSSVSTIFRLAHLIFRTRKQIFHHHALAIFHGDFHDSIFQGCCVALACRIHVIIAAIQRSSVLSGQLDLEVKCGAVMIISQHLLGDL